MANKNRSWMYQRLDGSGNVTDEFLHGLEEFVKYAKSRKEHLIEGRIRFPCATSSNRAAKRPRLGCNNVKFVHEHELYNHLYKHGFKADYEVWVSHGESRVDEPDTIFEPIAHPTVGDQPGQSMNVDEHVPNMIDMVMDAVRPDFVWDRTASTTEKPTKVVKDWLDILNAAREPVSECSKPSILEAAAECLNIKTEGNVSERTYNQFMDFIQKLLPGNNKMAKSWDDTCKIVKKIGLGFQLIDACINDEAPPRLSGDEILQRLSSLGPDKWGATNAKFNHHSFGEIHNWKKRSIFWDLPYWKTNLVRHNLDLMHIEKNVFDNIFNTIMDMAKSKDNSNARVDMEKLCDRRATMV